ncbi:free fatty acid receptor 3 [Gadus morhua]|uniref:free fatty acid receptor 3 n=1 Tax=Gadus morhua TaxID=8049 RepID=UPI0011B84201|nr:free fatty acid receptor 3-like [Gadus morhua]
MGASAVSVKDCVSLFVYCFTFLLGLPANLLVLFVYVRKARKRGATPNVVYALNLCLANLALVAWLPVKALEVFLQGWVLPGFLCPIYNFFLFASVYGSCLFLTAVTVGRYLSIAFPIAYKLYRRARISCFISVALWAVVLLHLSLGLVAEGGAFFVTRPDGEGGAAACYDHFDESQLEVLLPLRLEMAVCLFLVPLAITCFGTLRCVTLVWRSCLPAAGKRRVLAVALTTLAVFVVCYAPYNASHVVGFATWDDVWWRSGAMITSTCNVFLEPVVMLMLSPAVSRGIMGRVCGGSGRRPTSSVPRSAQSRPRNTLSQDPGGDVRENPSLSDKGPPEVTMTRLSQD